MIEGRYRVQGSDWRDVVLESEATNETVASQWHDASFYKLTIDGTTFDPNCFDVVAGENPMVARQEQ